MSHLSKMGNPECLHEPDGDRCAECENKCDYCGTDNNEVLMRGCACIIADSALAKAAPEILEVMKRALSLSLKHPDFCLHAMDQFHQAIARAEGRS